MELTQLAAWPITPRAAERIASGVNNESYFITADEGAYVLRISHNTLDPKRVRDEHDLLGHLAHQGLPFAVPTPVLTNDGDTLAVIETERGALLATLFQRIPGEPAQATTIGARLAGRALAQVDVALAQVERPVRAPGQLRDVHALVPDPVAAVGDLELAPDDRRRIATLIDRVMTSHDALAASLPWQIVHGDFAFANVLIDEDRVSGFVDFEFAGSDVRAADLACAIYITIVRTPAAERWRMIDALISGYRRSLSLDPIEAAAIPELLFRRSAQGLVHWIGRWRAGLTTREDVLGRVQRNAVLTGWLAANDARLALAVVGQAKLPAR